MKVSSLITEQSSAIPASQQLKVRDLYYTDDTLPGDHYYLKSLQTANIDTYEGSTQHDRFGDIEDSEKAVFSGSIEIEDEEDLTSLEGLPSQIQDSLYISLCPNVTSLAGLPKLVRNELCLYKMKGITSLEGLSSCKYFSMSEMELKNFRGFPQNSSSKDAKVAIHGSTLDSLEGLPSTLKDISFFNSKIKSFEGLPKNIELVSFNLYKGEQNSIDFNDFIKHAGTIKTILFMNCSLTSLPLLGIMGIKGVDYLGADNSNVSLEVAVDIAMRTNLDIFDTQERLLARGSEFEFFARAK